MSLWEETRTIGRESEGRVIVSSSLLRRYRLVVAEDRPEHGSPNVRVHASLRAGHMESEMLNDPDGHAGVDPRQGVLTSVSGGARQQGEAESRRRSGVVDFRLDHAHGFEQEADACRAAVVWDGSKLWAFAEVSGNGEDGEMEEVGVNGRPSAGGLSRHKRVLVDEWSAAVEVGEVVGEQFGVEGRGHCLEGDDMSWQTVDAEHTLVRGNCPSVHRLVQDGVEAGRAVVDDLSAAAVVDKPSSVLGGQGRRGRLPSFRLPLSRGRRVPVSANLVVTLRILGSFDLLLLADVMRGDDISQPLILLPEPVDLLLRGVATEKKRNKISQASCCSQR